MELNGAVLDMNTNELHWALASLAKNGIKSDGYGLIGNIRTMGYMIEIEESVDGSPCIDAYVGSCRNRFSIHGGSLVSCEYDRAAFVNAVSPKLGVPKSLRAVMTAMHEAVA